MKGLLLLNHTFDGLFGIFGTVNSLVLDGLESRLRFSGSNRKCIGIRATFFAISVASFSSMLIRLSGLAL